MPTIIENPSNPRIASHVATSYKLVDAMNDNHAPHGHNNRASKVAAKMAQAFTRDLIAHKRKKRRWFRRYPILAPNRADYKSDHDYRLAVDSYNLYNGFANRHPILTAVFVLAATFVLWQFL